MLLEGSAALSSTKAVSLEALLLVVFVNAINAAMNLVTDHKAALAEERDDQAGGDTLGLARLAPMPMPAPAPTAAESAAPAVHRTSAPRRPRKAPPRRPSPSMPSWP